MDGAISLPQFLSHYPATRDLPSSLDDSNSVDSLKNEQLSQAVGRPIVYWDWIRSHTDPLAPSILVNCTVWVDMPSDSHTTVHKIYHTREIYVHICRALHSLIHTYSVLLKQL